MHCEGEIDTSQKLDTLDECVDVCNNQDSCNAFNYNKNKTLCSIYVIDNPMPEVVQSGVSCFTRGTVFDL